MTRRRRQFGERINFKSLSCAPINEQGVVYLFGVLHDAFDLKIESVQTGFPDCIARRDMGNGRWEELRIEFEFQSTSFVKHKHDPDGVGMIICWKHDWQQCPDHIEVLELSSLIGDMEEISDEVKEPKKLTEYQRFCQEKRLQGISFTEIAKLWRQRKAGRTTQTEKPLPTWQEFCRIKRLEGLEFGEIARLWHEQKKKTS
jgi:hypothetical protein